MEQQSTPEKQDHLPEALAMNACDHCKKTLEKKISKPEWAMLAFLVAIFIISANGKKITEYLDEWQRGLIKPQMIALAEQGKPDAFLWVAQYAPELRSPKDIERLKAFAEQGHAESMYRYSEYLFSLKEDGLAQTMLQKAVDAGSPNAVNALYDRSHK